MAFNLISPVKLGQGSIATSLTTRYTVPAFTRTLVKDITVANTTTGPIALTVYLVPSAGTAGVSNALIYNVTIPGGTVFQWNGIQIMNSGDFIQDTANLTGLTINISGGEAV